MKVDQSTVLWGLAGAAGAYFLGKYMVKDAGREIGEAAGRVGQAVNPANDDNIFNQGANSLAERLTGQASWGIWLADILHPVEVANQPERETIIAQEPPEASVMPNSWQRDTPGPSGRASVTKEQFNDLRTM